VNVFKVKKTITTSLGLTSTFFFGQEMLKLNNSHNNEIRTLIRFVINEFASDSPFVLSNMLIAGCSRYLFKITCQERNELIRPPSQHHIGADFGYLHRNMYGETLPCVLRLGLSGQVTHRPRGTSLPTSQPTSPPNTCP